MKAIKVDLTVVDWSVMPWLKRLIEGGTTVNHRILKELIATIRTSGSSRTNLAVLRRSPSGDTPKRWR